MAEYISREEAIDKMRSLKSKFRANNDWDSGYDTAIAEAFEHIKRVPAADVQPVVRCKDCIERPHCQTHSDDFYCAFGERSDSND